MNKYIKFLLQPPITKKFPAKLKENFHTLTPLEMIIYFAFIRPFWSKDERFFFEGELKLLGQMYISERKALYNTIISEKPRHCFEIGTFTGGGSTYFLSKAFERIGQGTLYTMENDTHYYNKAKNFFATHLTNQNKHIEFIFGEKPSDFDKYLPQDKKVDCVFFDGAENAEQTLEQYNYFLPYLKKDSVIIFHDWNTEKTRSIKPVITGDTNWKLELELAPPTSIGLTVFKHL